MRKITMFYGRECPNANLMMPIIMGMNIGGKYKFEIFEIWHDNEGKKKFEESKDLIKEKTGEDNAVPIFIDEEKKDAVFVNDFEALMAWLEGPEWWKNM